MRATLSQRVVAIVAVLLLAPFCAELLAAYLSVAGDPSSSLVALLFLAPLYGGAALLVHEAVVRTRRGWQGAVLLATAFGVLMPTLVDLSAWTLGRSDVAGWSAIVGAARVGEVPVFALVSWVAGHVALSIGAPLLLVGGGVPGARGRSWIGPWGMVVVAVAGTAIGAAVNRDPERSGVVQASATAYVLSAALVVVLVAAAFSPLGRARRPVERHVPAAAVLLPVGLVLTAMLDLAPSGWVGVAAIVLAAGLALALPGRWAGSAGWTQRHSVALALGVVVERTAVGAVSPPAPGVSAAAVAVQAIVWAAVLVGVGAWAWRGAGRGAEQVAECAPVGTPFDDLDDDAARAVLTECLDVPRFVDEVLAGRPHGDADRVRAAASEAAGSLDDDELERALARHPRIGERAEAGRHDAAHSAREQSGVDRGDADLAARLLAGNRAYEDRFDRVFLIRAAGRSGPEILAELERRLDNDDTAERAETVEQLRQIAMLRLEPHLTADPS